MHPMVELARFGPDEKGNFYSLTRVFGNTSRHKNTPEGTFVVVEHRPDGNKKSIDAFVIEFSILDADEHCLTTLRFDDHAKDLDPRFYGIMLWALIELFGFDPDKHMSVWATFALQLPAIVRDGALDRFRAEPVMQDLNAVILERQEMPRWASDADFQENAEEISDLGLKALMALSRLDSSLVSDRAAESETRWRWNIWTGLSDEEDAALDEIVRSIVLSWEIVIDELEPVEIFLNVPNPDTRESVFWVIVSSDSGITLASETNLMTALESARLIMEESDWEPWYAKAVTQYAVNPQILLDINIEPYLLLDSPTPYMLPDEAFLQFLKEM